MKSRTNFSVQDTAGKKILMVTPHLQDAQDYLKESGNKNYKLMVTGVVGNNQGAPIIGWVEYTPVKKK